MIFSNNPFYILRLTCKAAAPDIDSAADKMYFTAGADACKAARAELENTASRLTAEIGWFADADQKTVNGICSDIEAGRRIPTDGLTSLSFINAAVYNLSLPDNIGAEDLTSAAIDIDSEYSRIDINALTEKINENRGASEFEPVSVTEVAAEIKKRRDRIFDDLAGILSSQDRDTYIGIVTAFAERYAKDNDPYSHFILSDLIDKYSADIQPVAEERISLIRSHIEEIKTFSDEEQIGKGVDALIGEVKEWDKTVQPMQLKARTAGLSHIPTETLGGELRGLSLFLNNEKGCTKTSLALVNAMRDVFAESDDFLRQFELDSEALKDLLKDPDDPAEFQKELDGLSEYAGRLKASATFTEVKDYVSRMKKLNKKIKNANFDEQIKSDMRETLCLTSRDLSIELNNGKSMSDAAFMTANALVAEFGDLSSVNYTVQSDLCTLLQARYPSVKTEAVQPVNKKRNTRIILIVFAGLILLSAMAVLFTTVFSKTVNVTAANVNEYFTITKNASYDNGVFTVHYSIKPKSDKYAQDPDSSDTITVTLGAAASNIQTYTGELKYNKKHTVTLKKSNNYTESGSFSFSFTSLSPSIHYQIDVTDCSGKIGKKSK